MSTPIAVAVECYSGHTFADRPLAFVWEGRRYEIERILKRWRAPDEAGFRVTTAHGSMFALTYSQSHDEWSLRPYPSRWETPGAERPQNTPDRSEARIDA